MGSMKYQKLRKLFLGLFLVVSLSSNGQKLYHLQFKH